MWVLICLCSWAYFSLCLLLCVFHEIGASPATSLEFSGDLRDPLRLHRLLESGTPEPGGPSAVGLAHP